MRTVKTVEQAPSPTGARTKDKRKKISLTGNHRHNWGGHLLIPQVFPLEWLEKGMLLFARGESDNQG